MANEETVVNRIITINEIEQIANYLENKKEDYERLINIDIKQLHHQVLII